MGTVCSSSQSVPPNRTQVPREPPLTTTPSISLEDLEAKVAKLLKLQQQTFQNAQQGKHLAELTQTEKRKAVGLVSSVCEKTKVYDQNLKEGKTIPSPEVQELQRAMNNLEKTALGRSEDQVNRYLRAQEQLDKEIQEQFEALKSLTETQKLPKEAALKLRECEEAMRKISNYVEESKKQRVEIEDQRKEIEKTLSEVPKLQTQLSPFVALAQPETGEGEVVMEEVQEFTSAEMTVPQEMEVGHEQMEEVEEENMQKGEWEVEVAAEAPGSGEGELESVYDDFGIRTQLAEQGLLAKIPEEKEGWTEKEVYRTFFGILEHMYQLDAECPTQPLDTSTLTVSYFLATHPHDSAVALSRFRTGLAQMRTDKAPYSDFIAAVLNIGSPMPYPAAIIAQLPCFVHFFDQIIQNEDKFRPKNQRQNSNLGKKLHLNHLIDLVSPLFDSKSDLFYGEFLERLHPSRVKYSDFLHFLLIHHMKSIPLDGISLFKQVSEDNILDFDEFEYGVRHFLQWGIPADSLQTLFSMMQNPDSGLIFRLDFIRFLRLQLYVENVENNDFEVTKMQVLEAFVEICVLKRKENLNNLIGKIREIGGNPQLISLQIAQKVMKSLGENRDISTIFEEKIGAEGVNFEGFVSIVEKHGFKISEKNYFNTGFRMDRKPELTEVPYEVSAFLATLN